MAAGKAEEPCVAVIVRDGPADRAVDRLCRLASTDEDAVALLRGRDDDLVVVGDYLAVLADPYRIADVDLLDDVASLPGLPAGVVEEVGDGCRCVPGQDADLLRRQLRATRLRHLLCILKDKVDRGLPLRVERVRAILRHEPGGSRHRLRPRAKQEAKWGLLDAEVWRCRVGHLWEEQPRSPVSLKHRLVRGLAIRLCRLQHPRCREQWREHRVRKRRLLPRGPVPLAEKRLRCVEVLAPLEPTDQQRLDVDAHVLKGGPRPDALLCCRWPGRKSTKDHVDHISRWRPLSHPTLVIQLLPGARDAGAAVRIRHVRHLVHHRQAVDCSGDGVLG